MVVGVLILYLRGSPFEELAFDLPEEQILDADPDMNFKLNAQAREIHINSQAALLKLKYTRQIIKCMNEYEIVLHLPSKMNAYMPEDDLELSNDSSNE